MVFDGRYKLCHYIGHPDELYDHENDPNEMKNRIADPALADERMRLTDLLLRHMDDCNQKRTLLSGKTACEKRVQIDRAYKAGEDITNML